MSVPIRTMVVDDETLGRRKILRFLEGDGDIELVGDHAGGDEAVTLICEKKPDLLFLDIQMPALNGFDLLRKVSAVYTPAVIFVTAYDRYAVHAFDVHALDYLLKPFDRERFREALQRAKEQIRQDREGGLSRRLLALLGEAAAVPSFPKSSSRNRLMVKFNGRIVFLRAEEIDWFEAQGDYVCVHAQGKKFLIRDKIGDIELRFAPELFVRIHRSTIVSIDRIRELEPLFYGEYAVSLTDGTRLTMSRSHRERVFSRLVAKPGEIRDQGGRNCQLSSNKE